MDNDQVRRDARSEAIRALMGVGLQRADAHTIMDLAKHASQEAQEAMVRVTLSAPIHLQPYVAAFATLLVGRVMRDGEDAIREIIREGP